MLSLYHQVSLHIFKYINPNNNDHLDSTIKTQIVQIILCDMFPMYLNYLLTEFKLQSNLPEPKQGLPEMLRNCMANLQVCFFNSFSKFSFEIKKTFKIPNTQNPLLIKYSLDLLWLISTLICWGFFLLGLF